VLPSGPPPDAPADVRVASKGRFVEVSWSPVPEATTYTVESTQGGVAHRVAPGLTRPEFTEPATDTGIVQYVVKAVNSNGQSVPSASASVAIDGAPTRHTMRMN
jgi:hypothetical protein